MASPDFLFSRRALVQGGRFLGLAFVCSRVMPSVRVSAAPAVTVSTPQIDLIAHCQAVISVLVSIDTTSMTRSFSIFGDLLERDAHERRTEHCGTLVPQTTSHPVPAPHVLRLTCNASAANLGLMRGVGPAHNETDDAEDVELFARIWVRDLSTREVFGPWDSPQCKAITNAWLTETQRLDLRTDDLQLPRRGLDLGTRTPMHFPTKDIPLPPQPCVAGDRGSE